MYRLRHLLLTNSHRAAILVSIPMIVSNNNGFQRNTKIEPQFCANNLFKQHLPLRRAHMSDGHQKTVKQIFDESLPSVVRTLQYSKTNTKNLLDIGTGFVVTEGDETLILTNSHCVNDCADITIKFSHKFNTSVLIVGQKDSQMIDSIRGRVIYAEPQMDLALIRIPALNRKAVSALKLSDSEPIEGQPVVIVGHPKQLEKCLNTGVITSPARKGLTEFGETLIKSDQTFISHTASTREGFSGSPVLDMSGQVVGIAFARQFNANAAIPAIEAKKFIARGLEFERQKETEIKTLFTTKKSLGVMLYRYPSLDGFIVFSAGNRPSNVENVLKKFDVITHINGTPFESIRVMTDAMNALTDDQELRLSVFRKETDPQHKEVNKSVTIHVRPHISGHSHCFVG